MSNNNEEWYLIGKSLHNYFKTAKVVRVNDVLTAIKDNVDYLISQAEQRGMAAQQILFDRLKSWNNEWRAENPKERALKMEDSLKLIEWKIEKSEHRGRESMAEELEILKTMCEDLKRERDCAEKKLKKVLEWADKKYQYTEKYKEMSPYFDGYNSSKDELRQILTGENN